MIYRLTAPGQLPACCDKLDIKIRYKLPFSQINTRAISSLIYSV